MQLAEKAIQDRLTRILVIIGACAGLCYNALWYFPVIILIGGVTTVIWDVWLQQIAGKMRAKREAKKRRARNEGVDVERVTTSPSIPLQEQAQAAEAKLTQRKPQAEGSKGYGSAEQNPTGQDTFASNSVREGAEGAEGVEAAPVADTKTHNISVKLGVSLIVGFLGTLPCPPLRLILTLHSVVRIIHGSPGRSS
jgi:hypothetical protein